ncbi:(2Fe-2S)-binding protein [Balneicella halophila]|uniref:(2Fe-2S)-binding protein n=1 Tax=Balneicella halophila TaxID=1537566 RepID=UPI000E30A61E|nr:(2Fe-2S)-binding protein [Balneicella halophila]
MQKVSIICNCSQVTLGEMHEAINAGAIRLEDIQKLTAVAMGCGRCSTQVKQILSKRSS